MSQVLTIDSVDESTIPYTILLELRVTDAEMIRELMTFADGGPREEYGMRALRIGLLALKQARGQLDGDTIKREGEQILAALETTLIQHCNGLNEKLTTELKAYFDPESGRFHERVQRLVKKDGELEELLRRQIGDKDSELCKTLTAHFGSASPLMKLLSPTESEGLLKALSVTLSQELKTQREHVLKEFSLNNAEGALTCLVTKLKENHGDLSQTLQTKIDHVTKEFSLDEKDSALSRLVRRVTRAQRIISDEFSLENEDSALSKMAKRLQTTSDAIDNHLTLDKDTSALFRLKRELTDLLKTHADNNKVFQDEVKAALTEMKVRREQAQRTTLQGLEFERLVFEFVHRDGQRAGDIVTPTGTTPGIIKNCKKGDVVIELGPEHCAAGARIVVESKNVDGFTLQRAREEVDEAKRNRLAGVGLFVFAKNTAPSGLEPFQRIGDDVFLIWDAEDLQSDLYLQAGLMVAKAICTRQAKQRDAHAADFAAIEKAVADIEKKAGDLDEIRTSAETIQNSAGKILKRVSLVRSGIEKQIEELRTLMSDLKVAFDDSGA